VAAISGRSICVSPIFGRSISVSDMSAILTRHATFLRARCKIPHVDSRFTSTREANTGVARVHRCKLNLIYQGIVFTSPDKTSYSRYAFLPCVNQDGRDSPEHERREKLKDRSWGVVFVAVHNSERIECRISSRTTSQCEGGRSKDFRAS